LELKGCTAEYDEKLLQFWKGYFFVSKEKLRESPRGGRPGGNRAGSGQNKSTSIYV